MSFTLLLKLKEIPFSFGNGKKREFSQDKKAQNDPSLHDLHCLAVVVLPACQLIRKAMPVEREIG